MCLSIIIVCRYRRVLLFRFVGFQLDGLWMDFACRPNELYSARKPFLFRIRTHITILHIYRTVARRVPQESGDGLGYDEISL